MSNENLKDEIKYLNRKIAVLDKKVKAQQKEFRQALAFLFDRSEYKELIKRGKIEYPKMLTETLEQYFNI